MKPLSMANTITIIFFSLLILIIPSNAFAYLDPGSGSFILQVIVAIVLGSFFVIKSYWKKIINFFAKKFSKIKEIDE